MSLLVQYLLKLFISLSIVWIFYQLVLRRLTFYNANRWFLLGYTLLSFLIPFINIAPVVDNSGGAARFIPTVQQYTFVFDESTDCPAPVLSTGYDKWDWLFFALVVGIVFFLAKFIIRCISFYRMRRQAKLVSSGEVNLYQVDKDIIPFSFGNSIFINQQLHNQSELQEIIRHEFVHVKQKHTHDIIWGELLCIINWYNPFAWLIRNAIRQNLEFIADNKVIKNGFDKKQYQYLLLKVIGNRHFSIANQFNFSSLKKRIAMMNKMKSARPHLFKFLFLLPLVVVLLFAFRTNQQQQDKQEQQTTKPATSAKATQPTSISNTGDYPDTILWISNQVDVQKTGELERLIGLDGSRDLFTSMLEGKRMRDTIPDELLNDKGYFIGIIDKKGNCTIVVWDKNKKEVARMLLTKWNEKGEYYEGLYGEILTPPTPPVPPAPPVPTNKFEAIPAPPAPPTPSGELMLDYVAPPAPVEAPKMPKGIRGISVNEHRAIVTMENGTVERYNLDKPEESKKFHDKYGDMPTPPEPPAINIKPAPVKVKITGSTPVNFQATPTMETISINPSVASVDVASTFTTPTNIKIQPAIVNLQLTPAVETVTLHPTAKVNTTATVDVKATTTAPATLKLRPVETITINPATVKPTVTEVKITPVPARVKEQ